jgi:predicted short-subunit dehydrogenase-like oxidoreductase (DUF2520 family)
VQKYSLQAIYQIQAVIIGTGKVANALGSALHNARLNIAGVFGRNALRAEKLASMLGTKAYNNAYDLPRDAGIYILAVSDDAVAEVSEQLGTVNGLVVHVSGSLPAGILSSVHQRYGVFYPLQTFTEGRHIDLNEVPFFVQAGHTDDLKILCAIAGLLSNNVIDSSDQMRAQLHLSAVFACNFVNALYDISAGLLESNALDFNILHPLIRETALKATAMPPSLAQTGPARRDDRKAIEKHLKLLENHPREKAVYIELTNFLLEKYHGKTL